MLNTERKCLCLVKVLSIVTIVFMLAGCATWDKCKGNNFPPLSSSAFPSFETVSKQIDDVTYKIVDGSGKTKVKVKMTMSYGGRSASGDIDMDAQWDNRIENGLFKSELILNMFMSMLNERKTVMCEMNGIHDTTGKLKEFAHTCNDNEFELKNDDLEKIERQVSECVKDSISRLGKPIKIGEPVPSCDTTINTNLSMLTKQNVQNSTALIVKGIGMYNGKKVIVAESSEDSSMNDQKLFVEKRAKYYALYDVDSFQVVATKGVVYGSVFDPRIGNIYLKFDLDGSVYNTQIRKIHDSSTSIMQ